MSIQFPDSRHHVQLWHARTILADKKTVPPEPQPETHNRVTRKLAVATLRLLASSRHHEDGLGVT